MAERKDNEQDDSKRLDFGYHDSFVAATIRFINMHQTQPIPTASPLIFLLLAFCLGCTTATEKEGSATRKAETKSSSAENAAPDSESELPMPELLRQLADNANPDENYHLNSQKAKLLQKSIDAGEPGNLEFKHAVQLLRSGQSEAAIEKFEKLIEAAGGIEKGPTEKTKLLFELLAISWLRKGEQDNCIANHNNESCILPLSEKAVHQNKTGSQRAVEIYQKLVTRFPSDLQSGYLYRLATMTLGEESGLNLESNSEEILAWPNVATELSVDEMGIAGGCAVDDFNGDGWLDIIASSYGYRDQLKYWLNDGQGGFTDNTKAAGLTGITGGINLNHVDYNNDGLLDVYVIRGGWLGSGGKHPNSLLRGNPDGTFTDVTSEAGILTRHPTHSAVWADFNLDGHIDLFVGNETSKFNYGDGTMSRGTEKHPCELFINNCDGTFIDQAKSARVNLSMFVKGVTSADYNNDGLPDLFLSIVDSQNLLLLNTTKEDNNVTFRGAPEYGASGLKYSFPTWSWDYNNDGHEDIFVAGYNLRQLKNVGGDYFAELRNKPVPLNRPALYRNNGDGTFTDVAKDARLRKSLFAMGCNYGDLDNDGYLDCYIGTGAPDFRSVVPNRMFHNRGGEKFDDVSFKGFSHIQKGHGIGWGDIDQDGDQDVYVVMGGAFEGDIAPNALFKNPGNNNHWIVLQLEGKESNRAAIGARVEVAITENGAERKIFRTVGTGSSFGSNSLQLEIGLGEATSIDSIFITWPNKDRSKASVGPVKLNTHYLIRESDESNPIAR